MKKSICIIYTLLTFCLTGSAQKWELITHDNGAASIVYDYWSGPYLHSIVLFSKTVLFVSIFTDGFGHNAANFGEYPEDESSIVFNNSNGDRIVVKGYTAAPSRGVEGFPFVFTDSASDVERIKEFLQGGNSFEIYIIDRDKNVDSYSSFTIKISDRLTPDMLNKLRVGNSK
jgi:hypothetical protein